MFYKKLLEIVAYAILSNINDGATLRKYVERLWLIGLLVVMLMLFFRCEELLLVLVLLGVGRILRNVYGTKGQNYVALFAGIEMSAGLHSRNKIFFCGLVAERLAQQNLTAKILLVFYQDTV